METNSLRISHETGAAREMLAEEIRNLERDAETDWRQYVPAFEKFVVERFCELWDAGWRPNRNRWTDEFLREVIPLLHPDVAEAQVSQYRCLWNELVPPSMRTAMNHNGLREGTIQWLEEALWKVYVYRPTPWESGEGSPDRQWPRRQTPAFWRSLRGEFDNLEERLRSTTKGPNSGPGHADWLQGSCYYAEVHRCRFVGGTDQRWVSDFIDVATRAGCSLGCPPGLDPVKFWICCLGRDLLKSSNDQIRKALSDTGRVRSGVIKDIPGSSLAYCARLAAEAETRSSEERFQSDLEQSNKDHDRGYTASSAKTIFEIGTVATDADKISAGSKTSNESIVAQQPAIIGTEPAVGDSKPRQKRGRKTMFTQDQLEKASQMKIDKKTNNEIAKTLYQTKTPTPAQRRGIPTILKHHFGSKK